MLISPVVVILWMVVTSIATPPPGNIARSANDKDSSNYRYKYTIDNDNGVGQGKVEMTSGELANGRYYINGEQSSTDVKYFADEWGYHPLVKYSASTGHSVANAKLALGEHAVKALFNDTNFADDTQMIEPQLSNSHAIYKVNNAKDVNVEGINGEPVTETHVTQAINDAALTTLEERLIIENSGSFGQRVFNTQTSESTPLKQNETHHTTHELSPHSSHQSIIHHVIPVYTDIAIKNSSLNDKSTVYNYKAALESIQEYYNAGSKEEINYEIPSSNLQVFHREFTSILQPDKTNSSLESGDNFKVELLEMPEPQVSPRFSKPIVVAEVPNSPQFEYSTTFPCNDFNDESAGSVTISTIDENIPSSTTPLSTLSSDTAVLVTPKLSSHSHITTSSVILNPIQAGVALVNAGEAHLITSNIETLQKDTDMSNDAYDSVKSTFNGHDEATNIASNSDQTIVIQKSHELYHNTPIQEIHYPGEVASQVVTINQLSPGYLNIPLYDNARQFQKEKPYTDIGNGNFAYQSIINRPDLLLQELQTSPEVSTFISHQDQQEKSNAKNLVNFRKSIENYSPLKNTTGETNFYNDTQLKPDNVYSPFELEKLLHNTLVNVQQTEESPVEFLKIQENNGQDNTKSSLQRLLSEERQANVYAQGIHIMGNTMPPTGIEMKEISSEIEKPPLPYTLSEDLGKSTIYIHGPAEQGLLVDIGNYASQTIQSQENPLEMDIFNVQKLQEKNFINTHQQQQPDVSQIYPVQANKVVEKPVTVLKPYTVPVERIVDKRPSYQLHKLLPQLYPIHILQPYPVEKIVEKPLAISIAAEKLVEKKVHAPQPYTMEIPIKTTYPLELTNYIDSSINIPYGVQYGVSYQQIMNPSANNLYDNNPIDQQIQTNASSKQFQGYHYDKPLIPFANSRFALTKRYGSLNQLSNNQQQPQPQQQTQQSTHLIYPKKINFANQLLLPLHSRTPNDQPITQPRHLVYRAIDKVTNKNHKYIGPVPLPQHTLNLHQQNQVVHPVHQETLRYLATVARTNGASNFRRTRLPDVHYQSRTSNFRQSKMEYGFKPPMVPSVQYDEQTATRVEN